MDDVIEPRYWNRYAKPGIAAAGKDKWKDVGTILLSNSATALGIIETDYSGDIKSCVSKMFDKWQRQKRGTWRHLLSALREADFKILADDIEARLSKPIDNRKEMTPKQM